MKIALLYPPREKHNTGVRNYTKEIIKEILVIDKENEYVLSDDEYFDSRRLPFSNIKWGGELQEYLRYDFLCYSEKVDIIHSFWNTFNGMKSKCKKIMTIYDLIPLIHPEWHTLKEYFDGPLRETASRSDLIITDSEHTKKDVIEYYEIPAEKIHVVYPGVMYDFSEDRCSTDVIKKYGLEDGYILTVSTIEPRKNLRGLINGYIMFKKSHKSCKTKLVLVGKIGWDMSFENDLDNISEYRDQIVLTGFVDDDEMRALYHNALAFAYVSFYEGFGLPLLEAMAIGKAVISSNTTSMPEVCGDAACYCNPYDRESIADAIARVAYNEEFRAELERKSIIQATNFSYSKAAQMTISIYNSVMIS